MPPPETVSLIFFCTGTDSPVKLDSSIWEVPSTTTPSAGSVSPVRTEISEPTGTRSAGTTTISLVSGWIKLACSGRNCTIVIKAFLALSDALASRNSEMENKNATLAASSHSPKAKAPIAAVTIMQLASYSHRRIVFHAFQATGGSPNKTDNTPAGNSNLSHPCTTESRDTIQNIPEQSTGILTRLARHRIISEFAFVSFACSVSSLPSIGRIKFST
mmetsp:Transcript_19894/g.54859  ORF Transcript_19894/g.54859 Transcript_19894/m.54859 type:complete len:217 (+) Transcript_19894:1264-1914(+)